jgi:phenylacetate-CoA ligase
MESTVPRAMLHVYYGLPTAARSAAASAFGWYLRQWRYGSRTTALVAEALARDRWSAARWQQHRQERLAYVLHRAATEVPYYREQWARRRRLGDRASWDYLENWPMLSKETVRRHPRAFLADGCRPWRMFAEHTSGTTGTPLALWWSRETVRRWYALNEARCRRWYGISRKDRWAIVGGRQVTPYAERRPPFWVWNAGLNQLYMSAYHLAPDLIPEYLDALIRYRVTYLFGYSSALHALAEGALRLGRTDVRLAAAITNAEPLYAHQRHAIARAFRCPVRETYGMAEIVAGASECERGRLHLWPDVGIVELFDGDRPVEPGAIGEMVCTGLLNADMPLIRYRTGDSARLSSETCPCRRSLPVVAALEGRTDDLVITPDGRRIGRLDVVFKTGLPIVEAQIVQEAVDRIRLRYVAAAGFSAATEEDMRARLRERLGPMEVVFEPIDRVPRGPSGKFRAVVSRLSPKERRALAVC